VATPLLASQLGWEDGNPILVGGSADEFALKCIQLYRNQLQWERLRQAGVERICRECSIDAFEAGVLDSLTRSKGAGTQRLSKARDYGVRSNVGMDR
jgi:hypothetical protein